jgi:hypothetical protein
MEPGRQGTFLNNMSWLDVSILREDETWTGAERMEPEMALLNEVPRNVSQGTEGGEEVKWYLGDDSFEVAPWLRQGGDRSRLKGEFQLVKHGDRLMWLLLRNKIASFEFLEKGLIGVRRSWIIIRKWVSNGGLIVTGLMILNICGEDL